MLRAGVIGSGPAAEAHTRAFAALADRCVLAEADDDLEALLRDADVVAVASAADDRLEHARAALAAGCDVLVEPLVTCTADDLIVTLSAGLAGAEPVHWLRATTSDGEIVADLLGGVVEARRATVERGGRRESTVQRTPPELGVGVGISVLETTATIAKRIELLANRPALRAAAPAA